MHTTRSILLLAGLLTCGLLESAQASPPSYLILQGPVAPHPHHTPQGYHAGYGYAVQPQAYSYGWFGAKPARQWTRHFGYYRNYTEWSGR